MKRRNIIFMSMLIVFLCAGHAGAQVYMVVKGEVSTPYHDLEEAIESAEEGATVFIPSGAHLVKKTATVNGTAREKTILIEKQLNLIGAGSESGLNNTVIQGNLTFTEGASRLYICGITVEQGSVRWHNTSNMMMTRCRMESTMYLSGAGTGNIIEESHLNTGIVQVPNLYASIGSASNIGYIEIILHKNKISGSSYYNQGNIIHLKTAQIFHNVIYYSNAGSYYSTNFQGCDGCSISNNILIPEFGSVNDNTHTLRTLATNSTISYNVCVKSLSDVPANTTVGHNTEGVDYAAIFRDAAMSDFHLADNSPAAGKGADGKDPGPFGSPVPAKDKRIPANPSFTDFVTGGTVRNDGQLTVSIKAEAQEN